MTVNQQATRQPAEVQPDLTASDPYRVLGVSSSASQIEIKQAYFALLRQYPPETEAENFKLIRGAYEKLKNLRTRTETDIFLPQPPLPWEAPSSTLSLDLAFHPDDAILALRHWGDLGREQFEEDFKEIAL